MCSLANVLSEIIPETLRGRFHFSEIEEKLNSMAASSDALTKSIRTINTDFRADRRLVQMCNRV